LFISSDLYELSAEAEDAEEKGGMVYIENVVVGHKPLSKAQYEQLDQQVCLLILCDILFDHDNGLTYHMCV